MPHFGRAYRPQGARPGREQELSGFHEERYDRLGEGDESVAQPRRRELQASGELDPPQQHGRSAEALSQNQVGKSRPYRTR